AREAYERASEATGVPVDMLTSGCRDARTARARFIVMRLLRNQYASYPQIGRAMELDHTTVMHGIERFDWLMGQSPEFAALAIEAGAVRGECKHR
ncbi:MAG: helix-turn-helix domain-containing protein, partial [Parvibaculum sp.]